MTSFSNVLEAAVTYPNPVTVNNIVTRITIAPNAYNNISNLNMTGIRDIEWTNNWIELPSLESLVIGDSNSPSNNFYDASLRLNGRIEFYFLSRFPFSCWSNSW